METIRVHSKSGSDGVLHLEIPVGAANAEFEVEIGLHPKKSEGTSPKTFSQTWLPGVIEKTAGSIQDETFFRHSQGEYENRLQLE